MRTLVRKEIDLSSSQERVWEYTYIPNSTDSSGNSVLGKVASMDGPLPGNEDLVSFEYNSQVLLIRIDYPLGLSVSYSYNAIGQRITETDMNGVVTEMAYDSRGRLVRSTRNGRSVSYKYSPKGLIEQLTDEAGRVTGFSYNEQKRVARIDYPAGEYLEMDYVYSQSDTEITESYCIRQQQGVG